MKKTFWVVLTALVLSAVLLAACGGGGGGGRPSCVPILRQIMPAKQIPLLATRQPSMKAKQCTPKTVNPATGQPAWATARRAHHSIRIPAISVRFERCQ